eukprot:TRINITY_DN4188_c1_g2_i2.p1 TRINITY_DN4188_c1_g2~~TRINITY_DN4188_c1_g2_i2.p1  ORF type:complete len:255 (-),score=31.27 TRINITY_DN4188_c1_g2_i2:79-804(-)
MTSTPPLPTHDTYVVLPAGHWLFECANLILLLSYATPDLLRLRILLAAASVCFCFWAVFILKVSVDTLVWNFVFVLINGYRIWEILRKSRVILLDEDRQYIYSQFFGAGTISNLTTRQFKKLAKTASVKSFYRGDYYCKAGEYCDKLAIIIEGSASLINEEDQQEVMQVKPNQRYQVGLCEGSSGVISPLYLLNWQHIYMSYIYIFPSPPGNQKHCHTIYVITIVIVVMITKLSSLLSSSL